MDGIILVNKEKGISSFGVVSKIRKIYNVKQVGHCGTLDPEAIGVLPIMIGKATKISKYLVEHDKEYIAILKLGIKTDSADGEGKIICNDNFKLKKENEKFYIEKIKSFIGKSSQIPPMYSAIKVNGKKLYEYARDGIEIERKPREIEIYDINIVHIDYKNTEITFKVSCSKGTYIRTLCEDIAEKIGTIGYMKELKRTKLDNFDISQSLKLSEIENSENKEKLLISIEEIFKDNSNIYLDDRKKTLFLNGVKIPQELDDGIYKIYNDEVFIGTGVVSEKRLKRDIVL